MYNRVALWSSQVARRAHNPEDGWVQIPPAPPRKSHPADTDARSVRKGGSSRVRLKITASRAVIYTMTNITTDTDLPWYKAAYRYHTLTLTQHPGGPATGTCSCGESWGPVDTAWSVRDAHVEHIWAEAASAAALFAQAETGGIQVEDVLGVETEIWVDVG